MGRELEGATFEPVRVGGGARRIAGLGVAWVAALVAVAGIAAANVTPGDGDDPDTAAIATDAPSTSQVVASDPGIAARPIAIVDVVEGRSFDATAGRLNRRLEITGHLFVRAARVRITLEGREDHILGTVARDLVAQPPSTSRNMPGTFLAAFELPASRSGGMWVIVTIFDAAGERIGRIRERVELYPIAPRGYAERAFGTFEPAA